LVFPSFGLYDFFDQSINLQPNKLMGAEPQRMVLAADRPAGVILATLGKKAKVGSKGQRSYEA
jgi:hypothetical protein